jgi:hypothetical protein
MDDRGRRAGFSACRGVDRQRMGNIDRRPQTADRRMEGGRWTVEVARRAFQPVGEVAVNEWGTNKRIQTADRGRQTAVGQAFQPVREVGRQRMGNIDRGRRTADRRRTGFPACQGSGPSTNGERINEFRPQTADGGPRYGRWTVDNRPWTATAHPGFPPAGGYRQ